MSPEEFQRMIAPLRDEYRAALPATLALITQLWQSVLDSKETQTDRETLRREVHNLAGTGTTFGLAELTEAARAFEQLWDVAGLPHQPLDPEPQQRARLQQAIDALSRAAQA